MNPFAQITPPLVQPRERKSLSARRLAMFVDAPSTATASGVRDRALLQLLSNGLSLYQLHILDLKHIDLDAYCIIVPGPDGRQSHMLISDAVDPTWLKLRQWLTIRKLFAVNSEAVFISLHWTAGRSQPGSRLSERGMRAMVTKYLTQVGVKEPHLNSQLICGNARMVHDKIRHT